MGRVVHFEIHADDPLRAQAFYENIFGWQIKKSESEDYWLVITSQQSSRLKGKGNDGIDGAIVRRKGQVPTHNNPVSAFVCTIDVENLDESCKKVVENGGNIVVDKMPVSGVGWLSYGKDTEGNIFGIMQPDSKAK